MGSVGNITGSAHFNCHRRQEGKETTYSLFQFFKICKRAFLITFFDFLKVFFLSKFYLLLSIAFNISYMSYHLITLSLRAAVSAITAFLTLEHIFLYITFQYWLVCVS